MGQAPEEQSDSGDPNRGRREAGKPSIAARGLAVGGGLALLLFAAVFLSVALDMRLGTTRRMGPGFVPLSLSILLVTLAVLVIVQALLSVERPEAGNWRPFVVISASVLVFAATIQRVGLVPSVIITTLVASLASTELRLFAKLALAVALAAFCWLVFIRGLGMSVPAFRWRF